MNTWTVSEKGLSKAGKTLYMHNKYNNDIITLSLLEKQRYKWFADDGKVSHNISCFFLGWYICMYMPHKNNMISYFMAKNFTGNLIFPLMINFTSISWGLPHDVNIFLTTTILQVYY